MLLKIAPLTVEGQSGNDEEESPARSSDRSKGEAPAILPVLLRLVSS